MSTEGTSFCSTKVCPLSTGDKLTGLPLSRPSIDGFAHSVDKTVQSDRQAQLQQHHQASQYSVDVAFYIIYHDKLRPPSNYAKPLNGVDDTRNLY